MAKSTRQYVFEGMELLPAALIPFVEKRLETSVKGHWQIEVVQRVPSGLRGSGVEDVEQHAAARDVAQEAVAEAPPLGGALDEPRHVGEHHVDR